MWARNYPVILRQFPLPHKFTYLLHAEHLRHGNDGFTSPPTEGVPMNFFALKICTFLFKYAKHRSKFKKNMFQLCFQVNDVIHRSTELSICALVGMFWQYSRSKTHLLCNNEICRKNSNLCWSEVKYAAKILL